MSASRIPSDSEADMGGHISAGHDSNKRKGSLESKQVESRTTLVDEGIKSFNAPLWSVHALD